MEAGFVGVLVSEFAGVLDGRGSDFVAIGATGSDLAAEQSDLGATAEFEAGFAGSVGEGSVLDFVAGGTDIVALGATGFDLAAEHSDLGATAEL